jgi:DNA-binding MarR family transcriptional regulator
VAPRTHPGNRFDVGRSFIGRPLRNVWTHFERELLVGIREAYGPDMTPASNRVMLMIDLEGTTVSELARRAGITKQSMAEAIALLEARGFVVREPSPEDRRAKWVRLTPEGREALAVGRQVAQAINDRWAALLGERKLARLQAQLAELAARLDEAAGEDDGGT